MLVCTITILLRLNMNKCHIRAMQALARVRVALPRGLACHVASTCAHPKSAPFLRYFEFNLIYFELNLLKYIYIYIYRVLTWQMTWHRQKSSRHVATYRHAMWQYMDAPCGSVYVYTCVFTRVRVRVCQCSCVHV